MDLYRTESCGGVLLRIESPSTWSLINCLEANCQEPSCPGPNISERLHKAELSRSTCQNQAFGILNTEKKY